MAKKKNGYFWWVRLSDGRYGSSTTRPTASCIAKSRASGLKQIKASDVVLIFDGLDRESGDRPIKVKLVRVK